MNQAPRRHTRALFAGVAAVLVLAAGAAALRWHQQARAGPSYVTAAVSRGDVVPGVTASGTVNPETTIQVGTYVSGVIQSISCDYNTQVRAGQLCARIDPRPYEVLVEQAAAVLATARAQQAKDRAALAYARQVFERGAALLARGIVSQETLDAARNAHDQAVTQLALDEASIAQHAAQLRAARINLGYTRIVSPVDGTVVSRNVTQGQTVAASFQTPTLFLIATDLARMQVDTNVSESDIGRIAAGQDATFTVESYPDRSFTGTVAQVRQAPQTVQNVVTYDVVVSVPNAGLLLRPGMTAAMRIVTARARDVLRVPEQALRYAPGGSAGRADHPEDGPARANRSVWVLAAGRPRRVDVAVGLADDDHAEVSGPGLREGDAVIVAERGGSAAARPAAAQQPRLPRP